MIIRCFEVVSGKLGHASKHLSERLSNRKCVKALGKSNVGTRPLRLPWQTFPYIINHVQSPSHNTSQHFTTQMYITTNHKYYHQDGPIFTNRGHTLFLLHPCAELLPTGPACSIPKALKNLSQAKQLYGSLLGMCMKTRQVPKGRVDGSVHRSPTVKMSDGSTCGDIGCLEMAIAKPGQMHE